MSDAQLPLGGDEISRPELRSYEEQSYARGYESVAGLDEVGRGPLAGPVVAAAVILPRGYLHPDIKDSKQLTTKQREEVVRLIERDAHAWGIGLATVRQIDRLNILQASLLAMVKALAALKAKVDCVLIDGNQTIPLNLFGAGRFAAGRTLYQRSIIKGDQRCLSIAAASIVAKVARDRIMAELDRQYPEYGFGAHKGYSCAAHFEALRRFGPSPAHRKSFRPVRSLCDDGSLGPLFD